MVDATKMCSNCLEEKQITEFSIYPSYRGRRISWCKSCKNSYQKIYRESNRIKISTQRCNYRIKKKYGLSPDDYKIMHESQGGLCAANNCLETTHGGRLSVDHDHSTGKVRGLLCHECNLALGRAGDSIEKLKGLIAYLERNSN